MLLSVGHHHGAIPHFSRLLGRKNTLAGTDTEQLSTTLSGCLVLHTDRNRNKNLLTEHCLKKVKPDKVLKLILSVNLSSDTTHCVEFLYACLCLSPLAREGDNSCMYII